MNRYKIVVTVFCVIIWDRSSKYPSTFFYFIDIVLDSRYPQHFPLSIIFVLLLKRLLYSLGKISFLSIMWCHQYFAWLSGIGPIETLISTSWDIVNWTFSNKLKWNYNRNSYILFYNKMHWKMSSGKWWPFCLGLNVLRVLKSALILLQFYSLRRVQVGSNVLVHQWYRQYCVDLLGPRFFFCSCDFQNWMKLRYDHLIILQLYENIQSNCPANHRISDHVHIIFEITSCGVYLQHVNWLAIPSTTHHGTERNRISNCVRQPGHTTPW